MHDVLFDSFFPGSLQQARRENSPRILIQNHEIIRLCNAKKIQEAFKSFQGNKAPGPDGIKPLVLQHLGGKTRGRLATIYNACLTMGYTPEGWRKAKVVLIPKVGKPDYYDPRAYRPITLASFLLKGLERIVGWYLEEVGVGEKISPYQHAFRKGFSTDTALSAVVDRIESSILRGGFSLGIFFDIEGAFDNIMTSKVTEGLKKKGVPKAVVDWYGFYLRNRRIYLAMDKLEKCRQLVKGTPQGGILSPFAWNVVFDGLLDRLAAFSGAHPVGYADDGMFILNGPCPNTLLELAQPIIDCASDWGRENGLKFSAKKTTAVLFHKKRKSGVKAEKKLSLDGVNLVLSQDVKYLGISFNRELSWGQHIRGRIAKCKGKLLRLKSAIGVRWGPSPRVTLWAYESIVIPILTYGSMVWGQTHFTMGLERSLSTLNTLAMLGTAPMRKSTPTAGLEVILNLKPLHLIIKERGLASHLRTKRKIFWDGIGLSGKRGHVHMWTKLCNKSGLPQVFDDQKVFHQNWDPPVQLGCNTKADFHCLLGTVTYEEKTSINYILGTMDQQIATGSIILEGPDEHQRMLHGFGLVMQAMFNRVREGNKIMIVGDFFPPKIMNPFVLCAKTARCIQWLSKLNQKAGHKPYLCNHKKARTKSAILCSLGEVRNDGLVVSTPLSGKEVSGITQSWGDKVWNRQWINSTGCRQSKLWFPRISVEKSRYIRQLDREKLGQWIQFLSGHGTLRRHQSVMDRDVDPTCRLCLEEDEDAEHLYTHCEALRWDRFNILRVGRLPIPFEWEPSQLDRFLRIPMVLLLCSPGVEQNC